MFDKVKFAQILKQISETYDNQREFSKKSEINRTYISQYINMKIDEPPKPKLLEKLANSSNGITSYQELMNICGYLGSNNITNDKLLEEYNKLNTLENKHDKEKFNDSLKKLYFFSSEEFRIYLTLQKDIFNYIYDNIKLDENDLNKLLKTYDFLSERSKKKLIKALFKFYNYEYEKHKIETNINNMTTNNFSNNDNIYLYNSPKIYMMAVYGQISAGQPNWAEECIEGRLPIDPSLMDIVNPEECFFLRVNGESMNKVVRNGAYALIRKTDWVENGEIAVVLVNGFDATLKKFSKQGDLVVLEPMSDDNSFQVQIYDKNTPIKILGKYIGKFEMK